MSKERPATAKWIRSLRSDLRKSRTRAMRKPLGQIKIIVLKGNRREHLAECDETGILLTTTLCERKYDAQSRTGNRAYDGPDSKTCPVCVHQYGMRKYGSLRGRRSDPEDLEKHFGLNWKPACGQDCAGPIVAKVQDVTCYKCIS